MNISKLRNYMNQCGTYIEGMRKYIGRKNNISKYGTIYEHNKEVYMGVQELLKKLEHYIETNDKRQ